MSKKKKIPLVNREMSWLSFNDRVLQEAEDESVPLLERLRFLGISSSNRDEFFRVRVATLKRMVGGGKRARAIVGEDPVKLLERIQRYVLTSQRRFDRTYTRILRELRREQIFIVNERQITRDQGAFVREFFRERVLPALSPIMLDQAPTFPSLRDRSIYLTVKLRQRTRASRPRYALIEVPTEVVGRFLVLPQTGERRSVMLLDDVVRYCLREIFPHHEYTALTAHTIKMTRDAELDIDNDISKSLVEKISGSVKKRKKGEPVRFGYDADMPEDLLRYIIKHLKVQREDLTPGSRYLNFRDFVSFPSLGRDDLRYPRFQPLEHPRFSDGRSMFEVIRERDVLLHFPYQSFRHVLDLLREASIDSRVTSIDITLYRVARVSNVVNALINAARNGKRVRVVVELQARFDEENNIFWANRLQEEGATVIFGVPHLKVHSKMCLVTRKEESKVVRYAHVGTGNFNESTATTYTDAALLTADTRLTHEVAQVFDFYADNLQHGHYKHILVSPFTMRRRLLSLIQTEIKNAEAGQKAEIFLKINNIVDRGMIEALYDASCAGVKIRIIVRGTCALVPGLHGVSENIEAISVVDKFLEHARVFIFHHGGEQRTFISSADWMTRNLDHRSETAVPIYDEEGQSELRQMLELQWRDNCKARVIGRKQDNIYRRDELPPLRSQDAAYALLKRAQAKHRKASRPRIRSEARSD